MGLNYQEMGNTILICTVQGPLYYVLPRTHKIFKMTLKMITGSMAFECMLPNVADGRRETLHNRGPLEVPSLQSLKGQCMLGNGEVCLPQQSTLSNDTFLQYGKMSSALLVFG